ncbi:MAG TPA: GldG family protein, partial [Polyangiaceae bacterium]|nr:GldG family protein [Polyangiaceae bacterium]
MKAELAALARRVPGAFGSAKLWSALGVLSASVIMVNVNVLCARFYERWDWTRAESFTLSSPTTKLLASLDQPLDIVVFLTRGDRLLVDVRHMLEAYAAHTQQLRVRYVDPERDPAEFLALQQKYGIVAGKTQEGKLLTDASLVLARGDDRWFLTPEDLVGLDADGNVEPRLEQALTEAIAQVTHGESLTVCFTEGHAEVSIDDVGPQGLAELRLRLSKSNLQVETTDLAKAGPKKDSLKKCKLVVIAGPGNVFDPPTAQTLREYYLAGGNVLVLLDPMVQGDGQLEKSGLAPLTSAAGIVPGDNFVIERDPELRLPDGFGEAFLATPAEHAITQGLRRADTKIDFRVLVVGAQSLGTTEGSAAKPLLTSSNRSFTLTDLSGVERSGGELTPIDDASGPYVLALAADRPSGSGDGAGNPTAKDGASGTSGQRMVVAGAANLAGSRNWRDPTLLGNRLFVENAVSWLVDRPALVSVPKRRSFPAGLSVTEESLSDVLLYVMV